MRVFHSGREEYFQLWAERQEKSPGKALRPNRVEPRRDWSAIPTSTATATTTTTTTTTATTTTTGAAGREICVSIGSQDTSTDFITIEI